MCAEVYIDPTHMNEVPEVALAAAVIYRVVGDLKSGSVAHKRKAADDVLAGGLEYWIGIVGSRYEVTGSLREGLKQLALRRVRLAG